MIPLYLILCALAAVAVEPRWGAAGASLLFFLLAAAGLCLAELFTPRNR